MATVNLISDKIVNGVLSQPASKLVLMLFIWLRGVPVVLLHFHAQIVATTASEVEGELPSNYCANFPREFLRSTSVCVCLCLCVYVCVFVCVCVGVWVCV